MGEFLDKDRGYRLIGGAIVLFVGFGAILLVQLADGYHATPTPDGMVVRVEVGEVRNPLARIYVEPVEGAHGVFRVFYPFTRSRGLEHEPKVREVRYPSGEVTVVDAEPAYPLDPPLDLNGDGVNDDIVIGEGPDLGLVQVLCGADEGVLYEQRDPMAHVNAGRAFSLGDLDGDGFGELALVHPRQDRSAYDFHLEDMLFDTKSWVTVISGSRLTW